MTVESTVTPNYHLWSVGQRSGPVLNKYNNDVKSQFTRQNIFAEFVQKDPFIKQLVYIEVYQ